MKVRYAALLPVFFAVACSNDQPVSDGQDTASKKDSVVATVEAPEVSSSLPSPLRVAAMFKRSGMKFYPGITNPSDKASGYNGTFSRAENMGVYSADMAYSVLNKQTNDAQKLLKTMRDLGTQINLGKVFEQSGLYDRFNKNLDNEDSLGAIIAEIQYQTQDQLEQNQQSELFDVIYAGAWVESMYIGSQVYQKDAKDDILLALLEQAVVCKNLTQELSTVKDKDPGIPGLLTDLMQVQDAINSMPSVKKLNENPELDFKDVKPTREELDPVIKKIEELRKKIVG